MRLVILFVAIAFSLQGMTYEIATTSSGKKVRLSSGGTYVVIQDGKDEYRRIEYYDLFFDADKLVGEKILLKGYVSFDQLRPDNKTPFGHISEDPSNDENHFTVSTEDLDREGIMVISKCRSFASCYVDLSGVVYRKNPDREIYYIGASSVLKLRTSY
jgi:hypothetical protein